MESWRWIWEWLDQCSVPGEWKCLTPSWASPSSDLRVTWQKSLGLFVAIQTGLENFAALLTELQTLTGPRKQTVCMKVVFLMQVTLWFSKLLLNPYLWSRAFCRAHRTNTTFLNFTSLPAVLALRSPLGRAQYPQRAGISVPHEGEFWATDGSMVSSFIVSPPWKDLQVLIFR